jgi:hypothetical protein
MAIIPTKNENVRLNYLWRGYENSKDITNAGKQILTEGSINVLIHDNEKIVPRGGARNFPDLGLDNGYNDDNGIIGEYSYYFDVAGKVLPIRISKQSVFGNELFEVLYPQSPSLLNPDGIPNYLTFGQSNTGTFKKYTFTTWLDKDTDQTYLIFCNGGPTIKMWTGGNVSGVTSTAPNTLTIPAGTWLSNGFIDTNPTTGVLINGTVYTVTSTYNSNTITVTPDPFGVVTNEIAFQEVTQINPNTSNGFNFDFCAQLYNQVYYGDFTKRRLLISNNRNQIATIGLPFFTNSQLNSAGLDDAIFTGTYTGSTNSVYKVVISEAHQDTYTFTSNGAGLDDTRIDTTGYLLQGRHTYRVVIDGTVSNLDLYKDNVFVSNLPIAGFTTLTFDGAVLEFDTTNHVSGDTWVLDISSEDLFSTYKDDVLISNNFPCTLTPFFIADGVSVNFNAVKGHAVGDTWTVKANRDIENAYANFYYDIPGREPGQGFEVILDSPFFTMHPQEKDMYVYCRGGHQYKIYPQLSSNLLNETIIVDALKLDPENIPQDNWLIGIFNNGLCTVTRDQSLQIIGRQILTELPQLKVMSDNIKKDLTKYNWKGGTIKHFNRNLYITLPHENLIFIWNDERKHWQPPQRFSRRIGLLSIIDNKLIGHDYDSRNSFELFVAGEFNDLPSSAEPNGFPIEKRIVLPYNNRGERFKLKKSYAIGFEGYVTGSHNIQYKINWILTNVLSQKLVEFLRYIALVIEHLSEKQTLVIMGLETT